jgi:hypothetical protein
MVDSEWRLNEGCEADPASNSALSKPWQATREIMHPHLTQTAKHTNSYGQESLRNLRRFVEMIKDNPITKSEISWPKVQEKRQASRLRFVQTSWMIGSWLLAQAPWSCLPFYGLRVYLLRLNYAFRGPSHIWIIFRCNRLNYRKIRKNRPLWKCSF